jgi:tight adherence protein B
VAVVVMVGMGVAATALAVRAAVAAGRRSAALARAGVGASGSPPAGRRPVPMPLLTPPAWALRWLTDLDVSPLVDPSLVWTAAIVAAGLLVVLALVTAGPPLALLAGMAIVGGAAVGRRLGQGRADRRYEQAVPLALDAVARGLRSGGSLAQSIGEAAGSVPGRLGTDLATVVTTAGRGLPLAAALGRWAERRPSSGVRLAVAALTLAAEAGGPQARAVDGVAATVREKLAVAAEVRALASQARASAAVLALAPLAFCAFTVTTDRRVAHLLLRTPLGWSLLATGLVLDGLALLWMGAITRVDQ